MTRRMTKEEALAWKERWRLVNEKELQELLATSADKKLEQVAALMASVEAFGWTEQLREGEEEVRDRWVRLRRSYAEKERPLGSPSRCP